MQKVGLTGNIGSGKSVVAMVFETLGVPVYDADTKAKEIIDTPEVLKRIREAFGDSMFDKNDKINRKKLADYVFAIKKELNRLNSIVHPRLINDFEKWIGENIAAPYVVMESAILYDTDNYKLFDKIIVVSAPKDIRIARVMKRDNVNKESVRMRMQNQHPESDITPKAHFVIVNDDKSLIIPQVLSIHDSMEAN
ncbi:MAG: dephospho-CoA kinase [Bacteroidales bacterium]|jgi:dephospho-CoA kinase